jgi:hypothetical protein
MPDLTAKRTLVKSPPELWEELSEVERLAKHLGAFGEITITKLEPEHTVAWEGEHASGTVSIEPSGWGTKVTLRAELPEPEREPVPEPEPEPEPLPVPEPEPEPALEPAAAASAEEAQHIGDKCGRFSVEPEPEPDEDVGEEAFEEVPRRGFWGWLFRRRTETVAAEPEPVVADPEPEPVAGEPEPEPLADEPAEPEPLAEEPAEPEPVAEEPEPEPVAEEPAEPEPVAEQPEPEPEPEPDPVDAEAAPEPVDDDPALDTERARVILDEALDTLGAAHHRPFSRG